MPEQKPLVRNAGDPEQVKRAGLKQSVARRVEVAELAELLQNPMFRRFYWRVLGHCKVFESIWEPSARIHYAAGIQDVGHFLMKELVETDPNALLAMMQEHNLEESKHDE